jgi:hypothetical protein
MGEAVALRNCPNPTPDAAPEFDRSTQRRAESVDKRWATTRGSFRDRRFTGVTCNLAVDVGIIGPKPTYRSLSGQSFPEGRLNEVASPSASATDASRVISSCQWFTAPIRDWRRTGDFRVLWKCPVSKQLQFKFHSCVCVSAFLQTALSKAPV